MTRPRYKAEAFIRGYLVCQFLACRRSPARPTGRELQQYLASYNQQITVRSCQRYLVAAETLGPLECAA